MTKKPIEAIFLDVDGTLLTSVFTISKKNVEALKRLQKAGVKIFLASGRPFAALAKIVDILSLPSYAIILNGGCIVSNNNEFMYSCEISQECAP
ncbi:MAG: HAD family phosphatase, partial [Candidatus Kuenenia stuttgartiensis]|nr:HAD family phosphatase [Candidatus Kuenenia stuttgartiensis]